MSVLEELIHFNPGKVKAEINEYMGSCFGSSPNIDDETDDDSMEDFVSVVKKEIIGKPILNVCSFINYKSFDDVTAFSIYNINKRIIPFRINSNIILILEDNIFSFSCSEDTFSLELNVEPIDAIDAEHLTPNELNKKYFNNSVYISNPVAFDVSWGFKDIIGAKIKDVSICYCCGSIEGINIELDNNFIIYLTLFADDSIDCLKR